MIMLHKSPFSPSLELISHVWILYLSCPYVFQLNSINQGNSEASSFSSLEEIMDKAYDKFDVEIKNVQLLFGRAGTKTKLLN